MQRLIEVLFAAVLTITASVILFGLATLAKADEMYLHYYVNANTSAAHLSAVKGLSMGYQVEALILHTRLEAGAIFDKRPHSTGHTGFAQASLGVEPVAFGSLYVHFFQGVGAVGSQDDYNSGIFQFFEDVGAGFLDRRTGTAVGLSYKHISNAGLSGKNLGRDLLGFQVTIPLF